MGDSEPDDLPLLRSPADGVPPVATTPEDLAAVQSALVGGSGPLAVDTERAHGYRYSTRAYLIQLRREGSGTHLIDPTGFWDDDTPADFSGLGTALGSAQWIIHAASQDTPCLAEVGMVPQTLFDTELAGRLLGWPKVGLGAMLERVLGVHLAKEHSAADWSTRPLPASWLTYAALDVELLIPLRAQLAEELTAAGKDEWARQEFAHLAAQADQPAPPRVDPWRRTSGIQNARNPLGLAVVKLVWEARESLARDLDRAPSKILRDQGISALGEAVGRYRRVERSMLRAIPEFQRRQAQRYESRWLQAAEQAVELPRSERPPVRGPQQGPPNTKGWARRAPEADQRRQRMRAVMDGLAETHQLNAENILSPSIWRDLAWEPVAADPVAVSEFLAEHGARPWQRELTAAALAEAIKA